MPIPVSVANRLGRALLPKALNDNLSSLHFQDRGHGYDSFGLHPEFIRLGAGLSWWIYARYFRVISKGSEHIPTNGGAILAANHSGNLPFDGMMLWHDVLFNTRPSRVVRGIADHFVPALPFIGTMFARAGMVGGSRGNVRALLESGELLMIFPEGTPGIVKPWSKRYQLQKFRVGHTEMAIRHQVPIVPVGVIGAEEQLPSFFSSRRLGRAFGIETLPIPIVPLPLPVRYRIFYGPPIDEHLGMSPAMADDPEIVSQLALSVQKAVDDLLQKGLSERQGIFK